MSIYRAKQIGAHSKTVPSWELRPSCVKFKKNMFKELESEERHLSKIWIKPPVKYDNVIYSSNSGKTLQENNNLFHLRLYFLDPREILVLWRSGNFMTKTFWNKVSHIPLWKRLTWKTVQTWWRQRGGNITRRKKKKPPSCSNYLLTIGKHCDFSMRNLNI